MMIMIKIKGEFDSDIAQMKKKTCGLKLHFCVRMEGYSSIIKQEYPVP